MDPENPIIPGMDKITFEFYVDKSKIIGRGKYSTYYKGYHMPTNQTIAVKFVPMKIYMTFPQLEYQFENLRWISTLDHPNIMKCYGYIENNEGFYFFLQFCNGGTLSDLIRQKMSEFKVVDLLKQIVDAIVHINSLSKFQIIIDKTKKNLLPEKIILNQNMQIKIFDVIKNRYISNKKQFVVLPRYDSPQDIMLEPYNYKCAVWSLGLIVYEMLTGKYLFEKFKKRAQLVEQVSKFANVNYFQRVPNQFSRQWDTIITKMLTYNIDNRWSFEQVKQHIENVEFVMIQGLRNKYGIDANIDTNDEKMLKQLINSINPSADSKNGVKCKSQQQKSFTILQNLMKWLTFIRNKAQFMKNLILQFNSTPYTKTRNVYKYILMFLSTAYAISTINKILQEIKSSKVVTIQGIVSEKQILKQHLDVYHYILKHNQRELNSQMQRQKGIVEKQILSKIIDTYFNRPQDKEIIKKYGNLSDLLYKAEEGSYMNQEVYMDIFRKVANSDGVYFNEHAIKQFSLADTPVYAYIRVIANIDEFLQNAKYKKDDYLMSKIQGLKNATKQEYQEIIIRYNVI